MTNEEYMKYMKSLEFLAKCGVDVRLLRHDEYEIGGFYKSGTVHVDLTNKIITARYDTEYPFDTFDKWSSLEEQLLYINMEWWERSKFRYDGWRDLDCDWHEVKEALEAKNNG